MYKTIIFETAIKENGYIANEFKYTDKSREVRKVEGCIPLVKYRTIDGKKQRYTKHKPVRWDASGKCFSRRSNVRLRKWDIDVQAVHERISNSEQN